MKMARIPLTMIDESLNIIYVPRADNPVSHSITKIGRQSVSAFLPSTTPVYSSQENYNMFYIEECMAERKPGFPYLCSVDSKLWHIDGLHRIIASRMNGEDRIIVDVNWGEE
jgi:hypothetical protein